MCEAGTNRLKITFPDLHILAVNEQTIFAPHMYRLNSTVHWCPTSIRAFNDWELETIEYLFDTISLAHISRRGWYKIYQVLPKTTVDVKSFYSTLHKDHKQGFPWRAIQKTKIPKKLAFFG